MAGKECSCACIIIIIMSIAFLTAFSLIRPSYLYPFPTMKATSASLTSLTTLPATFNLTVKLSKVGFMADNIWYDEFNVSLIFDSLRVEQATLGSGFQAKHRELIVHPQFLIEREKVAGNVTEKMVGDQKKGLVEYIVEVSTTVRFKRHVNDKITVTYLGSLKMEFKEEYCSGEVGLLYRPVDLFGNSFKFD